MFKLTSLCVMAIVVVGAGWSVDATSAEQHWLAKGGQAQAVIVVGRDAREFDRWVAGEVQRYVKQLSGAELRVVAADQLPSGQPLLVLGGPKANRLSASPEQRHLVRFAGLKQDGFIIQTIALPEGDSPALAARKPAQSPSRPAVVAGGNDEAATMYAAYELLQRLGVVFQLDRRHHSQQKPDLPLPALSVKMEPAIKYRGLHVRHLVMPKQFEQCHASFLKARDLAHKTAELLTAKVEDPDEKHILFRYNFAFVTPIEELGKAMSGWSVPE